MFRPQLFLSFDKVILCLARECITIVRCVAYIYEFFMTLTFYLNIKIIFSPWIWVWQDVFALWHRHTKFWHMGISPWDSMFCMTLTFDLYVGGGSILSEFYSQFLSCIILKSDFRFFYIAITIGTVTNCDTKWTLTWLNPLCGQGDRGRLQCLYCSSCLYLHPRSYQSYLIQLKAPPPFFFLVWYPCGFQI